MRFPFKNMKKKYASILCCPYCHGELKLEIKKEEGDEILEGKFLCNKCKKEYEIRDGIPIML